MYILFTIKIFKSCKCNRFTFNFALPKEESCFHVRSIRIYVWGSLVGILSKENAVAEIFESLYFGDYLFAVVNVGYVGRE